MQIITLALIFVGAIFATAEVSTVAITKAAGPADAASLVIGVYAVGSFVLGLIVGALNLQVPLHRQLADRGGRPRAHHLAAAGRRHVPLLAIAVFVSGIAISPTFITAFGLIERRVPEAMLTEGVTWVMTGIGIGMALGAFVSGWVVDTYRRPERLLGLGRRRCRNRHHRGTRPTQPLGRVHRRGRLRDAGTGAVGNKRKGQVRVGLLNAVERDPMMYAFASSSACRAPELSCTGAPTSYPQVSNSISINAGLKSSCYGT